MTTCDTIIHVEGYYVENNLIVYIFTAIIGFLVYFSIISKRIFHKNTVVTQTFHFKLKARLIASIKRIVKYLFT